MFFNKSHRITELEKEIIRLRHRIAELEDNLCPCEEHDWKYVRFRYLGSHIGHRHLYKCKRCGKTMESEVRLNDE